MAGLAAVVRGVVDYVGDAGDLLWRGGACVFDAGGFGIASDVAVDVIVSGTVVVCGGRVTWWLGFFRVGRWFLGERQGIRIEVVQRIPNPSDAGSSPASPGVMEEGWCWVVGGDGGG